MLTIDYNPLITAVIDSWRSRLPQDGAGRAIEVTETELRELIQDLCRAIDVLSRSMDTEALLDRLRQHSPEVGTDSKRTGAPG